MILYILRHAIALDKKEWKKSDSDRPLTKEGIKKMKKAAKGMHHMDLKIDWILSSPYRRAYDTALLVAKEFKLKKKLKISKALAPDGDPKLLIRYLTSNFRSWENVLLVGHEPYLGSLMGLLISGNSRSLIELDKGGLATLSTDSLTFGQSATLEMMISAKLLRIIR